MPHLSYAFYGKSELRSLHYHLHHSGKLLCLFGPLWGLLMWFFLWRSMGVPPTVAIAISIVAGGGFGFLMAVYHGWRKKANKLPDWNSLE